MVAVRVTGGGSATDRIGDNQCSGFKGGEGQPGVDVTDGELGRVGSEDLDFHRCEFDIECGGLARGDLRAGIEIGVGDDLDIAGTGCIEIAVCDGHGRL